jgi:putative membrane protein
VKRLVRGAFALGLVIIVVLVVRENAQSIAVLLSQAGWRLFLLVPLHTVPLFLDVMGWRVLIFERTRVCSLFLIAAIREAINRLLPVANVGGEFVGIRLLSREGISGVTATSSVILEMLLNLVAQFLFFELGLALLLRITGSVQGTGALLIVFVGPLPLLALLFWLLDSGALFRTLGKLGARMLDPKPKQLGSSSKLVQLDIAIRRLASAHGRMALGTIWQLAGLIAGCSETWLALSWLGHPVSLPAALALESFTLAARSLIFFAPAGLGVQEAGLIGVGHLLGLGSDVAIALSLAKRMREILFGLPALAVWQLIAHRSNSDLSRS